MCCHSLLPDPAVLTFQRCSVRDGTILVFAATRATRPGGARCPDCGWQASRVHSTYERRLRDLPWFGNAVEIALTSRKLFCDNPDCERRIFTERIPSVAERYARRTVRLASLFYMLVYAVGGEVGRRIAQAAGLLVSADTLLRLIRRPSGYPRDRNGHLRNERADSKTEEKTASTATAIAGVSTAALMQKPISAPLPSVPPVPPVPPVIGIDDFAFRKGHRYGTIIVDHEAGKPIDLLPSRDADAVAQWLKEHTGIKIITRDRSPAYAQAIREGAPDAVQVADRFHLLKNLVEAVERLLTRLHGTVAAVHKAIESAEIATGGVPTTTAIKAEPEPAGRPASPAPTADSERRRQRRAERFAEVKRLLTEGCSQREVARLTGRSRPTIRKYASHDTAPEIAARKRSRPSKLAPFAEYLRNRWYEDHCCCAIQLYREIAAQGYTGGHAQVQRLVQPWRKRPRCRTAGSGGGQARPPFPEPSPRSCAFLLLYPEQPRVTAEQRDFVERLVSRCPEVAGTQRLALRFIDLVKKRDADGADGLESWLADADSGGISEMKMFARGLRQDLAAVDAALALEWSNGPTEGQVNRLKLIKRSMYGGSNFDLLRARVLQPVPIGLSG